MICLPFLRQFGAPDVFFLRAPACTWNCMAHLSSFSPSIWRPWRFLPWSPCLHLKLHGAPLVLFSVNLAPLTFSSLEPLLALETAWRPSRPFLRQFGAPDVYFPGAPPDCTWNYMAPFSSFSPSIWSPWRFLPWIPCLYFKVHGTPLVLFSVNLAPLTFSSLELLLALETDGAPLVLFSVNLVPLTFSSLEPPCLHFKLHGAALVLFSVNLAPLTFSSLEPLLVPETAWRPSRPFLRQFGAPDVFFPEAPCLHLKLYGAPLVLFSVNLAPLTFSSLDPLLALETAWRPTRHIDLTFFLFFSCSFFLPFFLSYSLLFLFFPLFSLLSFFPFPFLLSFWRPFGDPGGPWPPKPPPRYAPAVLSAILIFELRRKLTVDLGQFELYDNVRISLYMYYLFTNFCFNQVGDLGLAVGAKTVQQITSIGVAGTFSHIPPEGYSSEKTKPDKFWDIWTWVMILRWK